MDIDKKIKIWNILFAASAITTVAAAGITAVDSVTDIAKDKHRCLPVILQENGILESEEFKKYTLNDSDNLYQKLTSGEISSAEFKIEFDKLSSEENIKKFALESNNTELQNIINNHDLDHKRFQQAFDDSIDKFKKGMSISGASLATCCVSVGVLEHYKRKKSKNSDNSSITFTKRIDEREMDME